MGESDERAGRNKVGQRTVVDKLWKDKSKEETEKRDTVHREFWRLQD